MRYIVFILLLPIISRLYAQDAKRPTGISAYENLISYYRYYKQDSAVYFAAEAINFARQHHDSIGEGLILLQQGMIDDNLGEFDEAAKKYNRALQIFKNKNFKKGTASATVRLGVVQLRNGNYDRAIADFIEALKVAEQIGNRFGVMEATYSIAWAYQDQKNYTAALQQLKLAEKLNDSLPLSNISLNIYNNLGSLYRDIGDYKKAEYYLEKGITNSNKIEYQGLNITLINNLASVYAKEGLTAKAIELQQTALARARAIHNYLRELQTLSGLAKSYGKDDPKKATFYLQQAINLAKEKKAYKQEMRFLRSISDVYELQGNYKEAFVARGREFSIADSFFYQSMTQNIAEIKAEYELSKSNNRVKELSYINNQNKLELEKSAFLKNVTLAGILLLMTIVALLYNQYRSKQRSNKEISDKNLKLQNLVNEKEWLLKEVHHRVKNNLQIIISLLNSQSAYLDNDEALKAIRNSQHRMHAMSLIHQKLYQSDNIASIDMNWYIRELAGYLRDCFDQNRKVLIQTDIDDITLDVVQAVPLSLILNESVTNAIKYAFPDGRTGTIKIAMKRMTEGVCSLTIADDGIGLPPGFKLEQADTLGMNLMYGLSQQVGGTLNLTSTRQGTLLSTTFKVNHQLADVLPNEQYGIIHTSP